VPGCALVRGNAIARAGVPQAHARPITAIEVRVTRFSRRHAAFGAARAVPGRPVRRTATPIGLTQTVVGSIIGAAGNSASTGGGETTSARAGAAIPVSGAGFALGTADTGAGSGLTGLTVLAVAIGAAVDEAEVAVLAQKFPGRALGDLDASIGRIPHLQTDDDLLAIARCPDMMLGIATLGGCLSETGPGKPRQDAENPSPAPASRHGADEMVERGSVHEAPPCYPNRPPWLIARLPQLRKDRARIKPNAPMWERFPW
jgi:hypothetical protein